MKRNSALGEKYYDLSNPVWEEMPCYLASFPAKIEQVSFVDQTRFNVHKATMATHHGTHVDAPRHLSNQGTSLEDLDFSRFIGEGVVLDLSFKEIGSGVAAKDLEKFSDLVRSGNIVILYTGCSNHLGESWVISSYTYLENTGAEWLVQKT